MNREIFCRRAELDQRSPTRVALIAAMEPVFAAVGGWWIGEVITLQVLIGGSLIMMGMLTAEVGHLLRRR